MSYLDIYVDMRVHTDSRNIPLYGIGFFWWLNNINNTEKGHGDNLLCLQAFDTAVSLKKGDFNTPSVFLFFQKENGGFELSIQDRR